MKTGKYGAANTNFSKLKLRKSVLHFFDKINHGEIGCGANALALLIGSNPKDFQKRAAHYSDAFMLRELRKAGYKVFEVNKSNLTRKKYPTTQLDDRHLILFSSLVNKGNASWTVTHNNYLYHNFEIFSSNFWTMMNNPVCSMYVLYKKSWGLEKPN